ncbi:MAG TPA: hypothetical protein VHC91_18445 [Trinickia sp.]|uniref:hypothetical protein n=1 Tax=Trinickia sp. TaxID=2571163 RepID=UPI002C69EDCE|nr:hypothetical protein [Trinickia sp.]HVW52338.1 hypothetical protein [Trinickia sp.]
MKNISIKIDEWKMSAWFTVVFYVICALLFGALMVHINFSGRIFYNEMGHHLQFAQRMLESGRILIPHFLFHIVAIGVHGIVARIDPALAFASHDPYVDDSWLVSSVIIMTTIYAVTIAFLEKYLDNFSVIYRRLLAVALITVQPIFVLALWDKMYYLGYITPSNIYIIPTQTLLKLTSIAVFMLTPMILRRNVRVWSAFWLSLLVVINGLSKPNYLIIAVPAIIVGSTIWYLRGRYINCVVLASYIVPSIGVLAWQYYFKFVNSDDVIYKSSITITAPFEVLAHLSRYPEVKLVLSVAFPAYFAIVYRRIVMGYWDILYALCLMFFGLIVAIFFAETGYARYAANFVWSAQIANFCLFVATAKVFFGDVRVHSSNRKAYFIGCMIFALHTLCGLIFFVRSFAFDYR